LQFQREEFLLRAGAAGDRQREGILQHDPAAGLGRLAGANLCDGMIPVDDALDHHLDPAAAFLLSEQARLDDAGVVENQQVAGGDQLRQVGKAPVVQRVAVDVQQSAGRALGGRVLGDQFGREREIEIVKGEHAGKMSAKQSCR